MNPILRKSIKPLWDQYQRIASKFPISKKPGNFLRLTDFPVTIEQYKNNNQPTLERLGWQLVTASQFNESEYVRWINKLNLEFSYNRKQWEWIYILNALEKSGLLMPGKKGLGFGCGNEPIVSAIASCGAEVMATDLNLSEAKSKGWVSGNMYSQNIDELNKFGICETQKFNELVEFRSCDMTNISPEFHDYDFLWSSCALEHLGSLSNGIDFIKNSLKCLKPGGIAVHTTEFNLSCENKTLDSGPVVLYRMRDILELAKSLMLDNHEIYPISFEFGNHLNDKHIDFPPYDMSNHLKLIYRRYITSSYGIIIKKH